MELEQAYRVVEHEVPDASDHEKKRMAIQIMLQCNAAGLEIDIITKE